MQRIGIEFSVPDLRAADLVEARRIVFKLQGAAPVEEFVFRLHDPGQIAMRDGTVNMDGITRKPLGV